MNLLPPNASKELRAFEETLEQKIIKLQELDLDLHPLTCKKEILPHLAFMYSLDISSLEVNKQREYIHNAFEIRRFQGTLYSIEKALDVIFDNAKATEWFDDTTLEPYHFRVDVELDAETKVYDEKLFTKATSLLNLAKNERSILDSFFISIPTITAEVNVSSGSDPLKFRPFMSVNELIVSDDISMNGGWMYEPTAKTKLDEGIALDDTTLTGGYKWQVEV